jgi:hypothetical protein
MIALISALLICAQAEVVLNDGIEAEYQARALLSLRKLSDCPAAITTIKTTIEASNKEAWKDGCKSFNELSKEIKKDKEKICDDANTESTLANWKSICTTTCTQYSTVADAIIANPPLTGDEPYVCAYYFAYGKSCDTISDCATLETNLTQLDSDCCGGSSCFPPTSSTLTASGPVTLGDLQIGDMIETQVGLEPVLGFLHKSNNDRTTYVSITHEQDTLELSGEHMLFLADGQSILAKQVLVGDRLTTLSGSTTVLEISTTNSKGFIAPLTPSGTIFVNGVVASTYTSPVGAMPQWVAHAALAPIRFLWSFMPEISSAVKPVPVVLTSA